MEMGPDEGMEFSKMLVVARDSADISKVWNDQPWLHSWVFGNVFHLVGFTPALPRLFALFCTLLYCARLRRIMPNGSGSWHHAVAIVLFLSSFSVMGLSMSSMLELPATLLALVGASVLFSPSSKHRLLSLFLGGALTGLAMQIKLTAGMVFGAATLGYTVLQIARFFQETERPVWKEAMRCYGVWLAGLLVIFFILVAVSPSFPINLLLANHVKATNGMPANELEKSSFHIIDLFSSAAVCLGFLLGAVWLIKHFRKGPWLLPVCYGFCAIFIHFLHRPYWYYYYLHLAAAFAPIAGWFIVEIVGLSFRQTGVSGEISVLSRNRVLTVMLWTALASLWIATDGANDSKQMSALLQSERPNENVVVNLLRSVAPQIKWAYSIKNIEVARAELLMVPELTVVPKKRFWAGYKDQDILATVIRYQPEVLVLQKSYEENNPEWQKFMRSSYNKAMETSDESVYFTKSIKSPAVLSGKERLQKLGL